MKTKRITIRDKKIAIIRSLVGHMQRNLYNMEHHIVDFEKSGDKILFHAELDAVFESLRCRSGNLNEVLEDNRIVLSIMYEGTEIENNESM